MKIQWTDDEEEKAGVMVEVEVEVEVEVLLKSKWLLFRGLAVRDSSSLLHTSVQYYVCFLSSEKIDRRTVIAD